MTALKDRREGPACILLDATRPMQYIVYFQTPAWEAAMEWCRFHGLDPCSIPAGSTILRDDRAHIIAYTVIVRHADGRIVMDGGAPVIEDRTERGEAGPLPFPPEITGRQS